MKDREKQPLNEQPNLLDIEFPLTEEEHLRRKFELDQRLAEVRESRGDQLWTDTLAEVPDEDKSRIDKTIQDSQDRGHIINQRQRPTDN